ncbi:MAG: methyltransferase domain-containing protein [Elusimicrobia bacterium]|nr:methyltransferase domain-containing protein [Elusimicrobiota bacterium]
MNKKKDLKAIYNRWYKDGAYEHSFTFLPYEESMTIIQSTNWEGRKVLEIGCGEGDLAAIIAYHGASVTAIDYSEEAIKIAKSKFNIKNLSFHCTQVEKLKSKFDVVVMQGVLEHIEKPFNMLGYIKSNLLRDKNSEIITESPSFLNPRGYIWMTLQLLFKVPMSLTDVHFLCPFDFEEIAEKLGMALSYKSCEQSWGGGQKLIIDFKKRLVNALRDAKMKADIKSLITWLEKAVRYSNYTEYSGASIVYRLFFGKQ